MKRILYFIITGLVFASCKKESSELFVPYTGNPLNDTVWTAQVAANAPANQLRIEFATQPLIDSFDAGNTAVVHFSNNVEVTLPSGSCVTANGTPVSGMVTIEVSHLGTKGDFVRFARPTTSYTTLLESGSAFYVKAEQNGEELFLQPGKRVIISFPDPNPVNNMQVFYGQENPSPPLPTGTSPLFTWLPAADSSRVGLVTGTGYDMFSEKFHWLNCLYYMDSTQPKTRVTSILPSNYTNTNTTVFAVFKNKRVVAQLYGDAESRSFFVPNIPIGSDVILVSLSLRGTEFYLGSREITAGDNMVVSMAPELKTKAEIDQYLDTL